MGTDNQSITFKGDLVSIGGNAVHVGDAAPDLELLDNDLNAVKLSSFKGKL